MANEKKTLKQYYAEVVEVLEKQGKTELVDFINGRVELLEKKSANKKMTETQSKNAEEKEIIHRIFIANPALVLTVSDLLKTKEFAEKDYSNQKMSALVNQMVDSGELKKEKVKGRTYFSLNTETVEG